MNVVHFGVIYYWNPCPGVGLGGIPGRSGVGAGGA